MNGKSEVWIVLKSTERMACLLGSPSCNSGRKSHPREANSLDRLSSAITCLPVEAKYSAEWDPMNATPPVTSILKRN